MNSLNIIPTYIITVLLCIMSYWHGSSEYGWRKAGLILNLILEKSRTDLKSYTGTCFLCSCNKDANIFVTFKYNLFASAGSLSLEHTASLNAIS